MPLTLRISCFSSVQDTKNIKQEEYPWDEFVDRLAVPEVTTRKTSVALFNTTTFITGGERRKVDAISVAALILDFDNGCKTVVDGKKVESRVVDPIYPEIITSLFAGYTFVLVSSYRHTTEWPRFRVIFPLVAEIPAQQWTSYAESAIRKLGLEGVSGLDPCYLRSIQPYYWPSHPPQGEFLHISNTGTYLSIPNPETLNKVDTPRGEKISRFTPEQISIYYADRFPDLVQDSSNDWRAACPLHKGERGDSFSINPHSGDWICFSECHQGGDIYLFECLLRATTDSTGEIKPLGFWEAKKTVDGFLGREEDVSLLGLSKDELEQRINGLPKGEPISKAIINAIAAKPPREREQLTHQLVTTYLVNPEDIKRDIKNARDNLKDNNVIQFPRHSLAAITETRANEEVGRELAMGGADEFGLRLPKNKYVITPEGVFPVKAVLKDDIFAYEVQWSRPLASRPLWPGVLGTDLATNRKYLRLHWFGSHKEEHREWCRGETTNEREVLLNLDDAPISLKNVVDISAYLSLAKQCVVEKPRNVTSATGWVGSHADRRFITPVQTDIEYIGKPIDIRGNVGDWSKPLAEIIQLGRAGYIALTVLALSAASPLVRLMGPHKRNPIIGLVSDSSRGKGTVINWGLSIWTHPGAMTLPAGSTLKGAQDLANFLTDAPIFYDEMQQILKWDTRKVEDFVYYMANGQRRVTSSRTQVAKGGERRFGVSFFAAESQVMANLQKGAQFRVLELHGDPLPDARTANLVNIATHQHYGQLGLLLGEILNINRDDYALDLEKRVVFLQDRYPALQGDDPFAIAMVHEGLGLIQEGTGMTLPVGAVEDWLAHWISTARVNVKETHEAVWSGLIDMIMSGNWNAAEPNILEEPSGYVAFKLKQATDAMECPLEIVPSAKRVTDFFKAAALNENIASRFADKGWIKRQGPNLKWQRRGKSMPGYGARVWKVTEAGLQIANLDMNLDEI